MYRMIIIDDEDAARNTLRDYIGKLHLPVEICAEAEDGENGLRLVQEWNPDIVFLDICMPGMDGLTLLKKIRAGNLSCKAVMLTAYGDFHYARMAVELQAFDYLLKPIRMDQLKSLMKRLCSALQEKEKEVSEYKTWKNAAQKNIAAYHNTVLSRFLRQDHDKDIIQEAYALLPNQGSFLISVYSAKQRKSHILSELIHLQETENKGPFIQTFFVDMPDDLAVAIHYLPNRGPKHAEFFKSYFELVAHLLQPKKSLGMIVGLSKIHESPDTVGEAYSEALASISSQFAFPKDSIILFEQCQSLTNSCSYPQELENKVLSALVYGNESNVLLYTNQFFDYLMEQRLNVALLKQLCMHFGLAVLKKIKSHPYSDSFAVPAESFFFDISKHRTIDDFKLFISGQLYALAGQIDQIKRSASHQKFVSEVQNYLKSHIAEDIGLQDISDYFGLTPSYFSTLFKREFQENFVEYCTKNKLSYANHLLCNPRYSVTEISKMIGYHDPRYFFKVYKKYQGISPGEYRKQAHMKLKESDK